MSDCTLIAVRLTYGEAPRTQSSFRVQQTTFCNPEGAPMAKTATKPAAAKSASSQPAKLSAEDLIRHYRDMLLIRRFEEKAGQLYGMGLIGGFCHLYIGQEAVVVGMQAASEEGDAVITS